jgi:uncharacterized protein (DUF362 family)
MSAHRRTRKNVHPFGCVSRRNFLKLAGVAAGGAALTGCRGTASAPAPTAAPSAAPPYPVPARVAIAQAADYDPVLVRNRTEALLDSLGGIADVVQPGDSVAVKVNLTGGVAGGPPPAGTTAPESYVTHPAVARAVCELLRDAGAKKIYIVEAVWQWASFVEWGYVEMAEAVGATLIDLNRTDPYGDYAATPVAGDGFIYKNFKFNRLLEEADALVSVPKMKCHYLLGVTQSMKNLVGLAPYKFYELKAGDGYRTGFHGKENETGTRLPRVVMDLNRARPVNLSLIDGIRTVEGSEGPWNQDLGAVSPGLLIGGKNPVSTDAVAAAAMGFDPAAEYPNPPFLRAENHLNIAYALGLGSNRLEDIDILGADLDDVKMDFQPAWGKPD